MRRRPGVAGAAVALEPRFRDYDDVAGLHLEIGAHVTLVEQVRQAHVIGLLAVTGAPYQLCPVAGRKLAQSANLDHDVQQAKVVTVGERLWLGGLADNTNLLVEGTDKRR